MESELIALDTTCIEVEWIKNLLLDIPLVSNSLLAISVHCDSKLVIDLVNQSHTTKKMNKHLQVRHKLVRNLLNKNVISLDLVRFEKNVVDQLTIGFSRNFVLESSRGMRLRPLRKSPLEVTDYYSKSVIL